MPTEPTPKKPQPLGKTVPVGQLVYGVGEVETGHIKRMADRYTVVNSIGAHGRYQVMRANIGPWTKEALGRAYTPAQFLASPKAQDQVAAYYLGRHQKKYGDWRAAASIWFSGQPDWNSSASDGTNKVFEYVKKVANAMGGGGSVDAGGGGGAQDAGLTDSLSGIVAGITKPFVDIAAALLSVGQFAEFLLKLALPSTWVRIVCGIFGMAFLIGGLIVLGLEAKGT